MRRIVLSSTALLLASACRTDTVPPANTNAAAAEVSPAAGVDPKVAAEVVASMNLEMDPCTDFYAYACGGWLEKTELPPDESRFGRFNVLRDRNLEALKGILEQSEPQSQLGQFYGACMDENAIEQRGTAALDPYLSEIAAVRDTNALAATVAMLHRIGVDALLGFDVGPDYKDSTVNITHLSQGGLGLPDRDYYLGQSDEQKALRDAYLAHVQKMLELAGDTDAAKSAAHVLAFETQLAEIAMPRDQLRDPHKRYSPSDPAALAKLAPQFPWKVLFAALGYPAVDRLNLTPKTYFEQIGQVVAKAKPERWRAYLRWQLVHEMVDTLPKPFVDEDFGFFAAKLRGQQSIAPRWKRCVRATDRSLGELLGARYVEAHFAGDSRGVALDMIQQIEAAFATGLPALEWMDDTTRTRAREKMQAIVNKIGHPDTFRDYASVETGGDYFANVAAARSFEFDRRASQIGGPVDKAEWHMTPPTVNAYYNPPNNEMVFPAGILQPPFFHVDYPMAMNFGGIGMVMGHELTHGFDDSGRKFDAKGSMTEWWEPEAVTRFEERAACVENLYSGYEVQPGVNLNGKLTLGENIADFGGIKDSHAAFLRYAESHGIDPQAAVSEGITQEQLFFVAYGQLWCTKATPEVERVLALTDPHSHARYRVNGPVSNLPAFWDAFSCADPAPMRTPNACEVW